MTIKEYLERQGYSTVDDSQRLDIQLWLDWYAGFVDKFHKYTTYNGLTYVSQCRAYLGMAKYVSEDWANLLFNEKVRITAGKLDETLQHVFEQNNFYVKANQTIELAFALGTGAFVEYLSNGEVVIDYIRADMIYPLSWENGYISECAFASEQTLNGKPIYYIQIHRFESGQYVIYNKRVDQKSGRELPLPEGVLEEVQTGSTEPLFQIITPNIVNNANLDSPMGISIYGNAIEQLKGVDLVFDSYMNEFKLGKKRLIVPTTMTKIQMTEDGIIKPIFDTNDVCYTAMDMGDGASSIQEINMTLRSNEHETALQKALDILALKCGLGAGRYQFNGGVARTATEVIEGESDLQQSVSKHSLVIASVLKGLVRSIGYLTGTEVEELNINLDDSVFRSPASERKQDMADVGLGVMGKAEYRAKWYGETEEDAEKNIPKELIDSIGGE